MAKNMPTRARRSPRRSPRHEATSRDNRLGALPDGAGGAVVAVTGLEPFYRSCDQLATSLPGRREGRRGARGGRVAGEGVGVGGRGVVWRDSLESSSFSGAPVIERSRNSPKNGRPPGEAAVRGGRPGSTSEKAPGRGPPAQRSGMHQAGEALFDFAQVHGAGGRRGADRRSLADQDSQGDSDPERGMELR